MCKENREHNVLTVNRLSTSSKPCLSSPFEFSSKTPLIQNNPISSSFFSFLIMESMNLVKGYDNLNNSIQDPVSLATRRAAHKRRLTIALSLTLFLTLLIFALVSALVHAPHSKHPHPQNPSSSNSLKMVCAVTQHPESCYNSISSLPEPDSKPDPVQYLNLSIQVAVKELTNCSTLPKLLIPKVNDPGSVSALKDCMSLFDNALSQLNDSANELSKVGPTSDEMKVNNMQTWISAAMTDQDTCIEGLDEMGSPLVGEVKVRVQKGKEYLSNTLAILTNLPTLLKKFGVSMH